METRTKNLLTYWQRIVKFEPITIKIQKYDPTRSSHCELRSDSFLSIPLRPRSPDEACYFEELCAAQDKSQDQAKKLQFELILGQISHNALYQLINEKLPEEKQIELIDREQGESFLFYLRLDSDGYYVDNTFKLSEFLHAMCSMIHDSLPRAQEISDNIPAHLLPKEEVIKPSHLEQILHYILEQLKISNWASQLSVDKYGNEDWQICLGLFEPGSNKQEAIFQMDYYSDDLAMLQKSELHKHYLQNLILAKPIHQRYQIDNNPDYLIEHTSAKKHSAGKWPSKHNPTLMQKVAINIATQAEPPRVFSVNGPPGTGKTTLLKEIVANAVVEKANIIRNLLDKNGNGHKLDRKETQSTVSFNKYFYEIPDELKAHSIIVASNNNAAVENISKELPLAKELSADKTYTNLFDTGLHEEIYFTKLAKELFEDLGEDVFGLIAAPYGRKENINKILKILPGIYDRFDEFSYGLAQKPDLADAKASFVTALNQFERIKDTMDLEITEFLNHQHELTEAQALIAGTDHEQIKITIKEHNEQVEYIKTRLQRHLLELEYIKNQQQNNSTSSNWLSKLLSLFFRKKPQCTTDDNETFKLLLTQIKELEAKHDRLEAQLKLLKRQNNSHEKVIALQLKLTELGKKPIFQGFTSLSNEFREQLFEEKSQMLCPWVNDEFNEANENLFHAALQLTKAFVCHNEQIFQNLKRFVAINGGENTGYTEVERSQVLLEGFHSLNLLIPVLSTTFASVQNAFRGIGMNQLGLVIIDEAGQATPFSALGLLYRSRRCIVVGDPLQVEPIISTPPSLNRWAYNLLGLQQNHTEFKIAGRTLSHASEALSIQVMADACNPFYGEIAGTTVGCPLVVHRRCLSPMFDISNAISYDNRMINQAMPKDKVFALEQNAWIQDAGQKSGEQNHFVKSQGEKVLQLIGDARLRLAAEGENIFEEGKLYVISPFKTVANAIKNIVRSAYSNDESARSWCESSVGTVHTFQGKEAECVIIVLGSDKKSEGAAMWASSQANILNVAVTRAKYRLVIIGDRDLWATKPYFDVAYEKLVDATTNGLSMSG